MFSSSCLGDAQVGQLQGELDAAYQAAFQRVQLSEEAEAAKEELAHFSEAAFSRLGRNNPKVSQHSELCEACGLNGTHIARSHMLDTCKL